MEYSLFIILLVAVSWKEVSSINCYQCVSTDLDHPFQCNEYLSDDIDITPQSCDNVYGAAFCVKHTGRFEGRRCWLKEIKTNPGPPPLTFCKELTVSSIKCYQCAGINNTDCTDLLIHKQDTTVRAQECSHLYGAQYCIKTFGRYGGGIGTKRFCSSLNLGNYCNYIRQPGDELLYRSCVYTCDSDGCNGSATISLGLLTLFLTLYFTLI